ncbi:MAG: excinuclease ABC subunit UvrC [Desulfobacterales bacterium]
MNNNKNSDLVEKLSSVTFKPGVYLMKDAQGEVIYVGKAQNLKKRLSSYFTQHGDIGIKTRVLIKKIDTFETIVTETEKEALILEANLIKRHRPRYNVTFRDDKRYPSLRLDINNLYPSLAIVRKIKNDGELYFGPFASAFAVRQTLKIIHRTFKLRKCKTREFRKRTRPCLNYQMDACLAPCCLEVSKETYDDVVKEVILFLKGRTPELVKKIKKEMARAAENQAYERAAALRDKTISLQKTLEKQVAVTTDFRDRDVIGLAREPERSVITVLVVRNGFLLGTRHVTFKETMSTNAELIGLFLRQDYQKGGFIPKEVVVPFYPEEAPLLEDQLKKIKGSKVTILWPRRGEKARLVKLAMENAENHLKELKTAEALNRYMIARLQKRLRLVKIPERIECFDNSNISGTNPVASMVVFENGNPARSFYRRYKIKSVPIHDDYAYMAEALKRRFGRGQDSRPYPDLLMVDGGKGQLNVALSVLRELALDETVEVVGIAKKDQKKGEHEDKVFKPNQSNPLSFGKERDLLLFLQRIRNEAHRFAITFHRKRRAKTALTSVFDSIPGIGQKRKEILMKHYGSIKKIRTAAVEELTALPGMNRRAAESIKEHLK